MLGKDLAALYQVETKVFNQSVKRNNGPFFYKPDILLKLADIEKQGNLNEEKIQASLIA